MVTVRLNVDLDTEGVERALRRVRDALEPPSLTESTGAGADAFVDAARIAAPKRSGALAASISKTHELDAAWSIGPDTDAIDYAVIQNFGGVIFPKFANALRFEINGRVIFAKHVRIPGTHYMETAFEAGVEPATRAVAQAIDDAINLSVE